MSSSNQIICTQLAEQLRNLTADFFTQKKQMTSYQFQQYLPNFLGKHNCKIGGEFSEELIFMTPFHHVVFIENIEDINERTSMRKKKVFLWETTETYKYIYISVDSKKQNGYKLQGFRTDWDPEIRNLSKGETILAVGSVTAVVNSENGKVTFHTCGDHFACTHIA